MGRGKKLDNLPGIGWLAETWDTREAIGYPVVVSAYEGEGHITRMQLFGEGKDVAVLKAYVEKCACKIRLAGFP